MPPSQVLRDEQQRSAWRLLGWTTTVTKTKHLSALKPGDTVETSSLAARNQEVSEPKGEGTHSKAVAKTSLLPPGVLMQGTEGSLFGSHQVYKLSHMKR